MPRCPFLRYLSRLASFAQRNPRFSSVEDLFLLNSVLAKRRRMSVRGINKEKRTEDIQYFDTKAVKRKPSSCVGMNTVVVSSPIGEMQIQSCQKGLHLVKQCEADDKSFSPDDSCLVEVEKKSEAKIPLPAEQCIEWLSNYFAHRTAEQDIPSLCPTILNEGSFRCQAWTTLPSAVPFGRRITYLQLATLCGNAQACRAAGTAMSSNPISLLIPCHRVIPSSGGVGNYSGGKKNLIKAWLLDFEQDHSKNG